MYTKPLTAAKKAAKAFALKALVQNAVQSVQYVALGNVMKRDLMEKFGLTQEQAEYELAVLCDNLTRRIGRLGGSADDGHCKPPSLV